MSAAITNALQSRKDIDEEKTVIPMKKLLGMLMVAGLVAASGVAYSESKAVDTVKERIAPVGKVCMSGEPCAAAPAAPASAGPKSGKDLYSSVCTNCHGTGVLGAPKFGNAGDWGPRVAKGLDTLYTHAIGGFNSMPPKGTCAACTDDEIKGAVKYMVDGSK
ncbi:c-type cytochrome [Cellvibrio sp.]|uniref:c-type cytochrome n=1 Tax=Cellvibrio sp. TaxID=1965322 RepID=UPI0039647BD3